VLADNTLSHPEGMAPFLEMLDAQADFQRVVVPIGKGLCIACKGATP
jgi:hypothetical protein